jgi:hypothetical protein
MSALPDDPFVTAENGWGQALDTGRLLCRALLELDADDDADGLVAALARWMRSTFATRCWRWSRRARA